jgi:hypothetical protein
VAAHSCALPERRAKHPQFTLRTFLISVLVVGTLLGWLGKWLRDRSQVAQRARRQARIVAKLGGSVSDACYRDGYVIHLFLSKARFADDDLRHLNRLTHLQRLDLEGTVTDAGLVHLEGLRDLLHLELWDTKIGDPGLDHLKPLTKLQYLRLNGANITDAGLERLAGLQNLLILELRGTKVRGPGLAYLAELPRLCELTLGPGLLNYSCEIDDSALVHLKRLTSLTYLILNDTHVSEAGVRELRQALPRALIDY